MIEATTSPETRNTMEAAHEARGAAVREFAIAVRSLFKRPESKPAPAALACH